MDKAKVTEWRSVGLLVMGSFGAISATVFGFGKAKGMEAHIGEVSFGLAAVGLLTAVLSMAEVWPFRPKSPRPAGSQLADLQKMAIHVSAVLEHESPAEQERVLTIWLHEFRAVTRGKLPVHVRWHLWRGSRSLLGQFERRARWLLDEAGYEPDDGSWWFAVLPWFRHDQLVMRLSLNRQQGLQLVNAVCEVATPTGDTFAATAPMTPGLWFHDVHYPQHFADAPPVENGRYITSWKVRGHAGRFTRTFIVDDHTVRYERPTDPRPEGRRHPRRHPRPAPQPSTGGPTLPQTERRS